MARAGVQVDLLELNHMELINWLDSVGASLGLKMSSTQSNTEGNLIISQRKIKPGAKKDTG